MTILFVFPAWSKTKVLPLSQIRFQELQFVHNSEQVLATLTNGKKVVLENSGSDFERALKNHSFDAIATLKHSLNVYFTTLEDNPVALDQEQSLKGLVSLIALSSGGIDANIDWQNTMRLAKHLQTYFSRGVDVSSKFSLAD